MNSATKNIDAVGKVFLVGAGPGDAELLTLKGKRCLEAADVILYDELVNAALLVYASKSCELRYVGKRAGARCDEQWAIETQLIDLARQGKNVVRLKGGDPFVFGRGGEEAQALRAAGIAFEIVPGISSAVAVPAYAGIPLTHRSCASSVVFVTGHTVGEGEIKWGMLAQCADTLVILMGLHNLRAIMGALLDGGCEPERPAALIEQGTLASQKTAIGTVGTIAALAKEFGFRSPTLIVVGNVVRLANELTWFERTVDTWPTVIHANLHVNV
jgi:uroporphyrinogen III methyltransferase/synthase